MNDKVQILVALKADLEDEFRKTKAAGLATISDEVPDQFTGHNKEWIRKSWLSLADHVEPQSHPFRQRANALLRVIKSIDQAIEALERVPS